MSSSQRRNPDIIAPMNEPIYLDYAATTPIDPRVAAVMADCLTQTGCFGNPASSTHIYGWEAQQAVGKARKQVAELLNCLPADVIWTSGATESNNLAIKGTFFGQSSKSHLITLVSEHKSVLDTCKFLRDYHGAELTLLKPQSNGRVNMAELEAAIKSDTLLISIMHVNNELGVIQDIQAIGEMAHQYGVLLHVDAAQSAGKLPIDLKSLPVDLLSLSAHKMYGPKGIGCLVVKQNIQSSIQCQIHGGGHERGLRSGTLATHQLVGFGEAASIAQHEMLQEGPRLTQLRDKLWAALSNLPGAHRHGCIQACSPHHLNVSFDPFPAELLINSFTDIAISSGSACNSASLNASPVLESLGVSQVLVQGALRFSVGRFTTEAEIDRVIVHVIDKVTALQSVKGSLWA
jgi:cysteine desulfurase